LESGLRGAAGSSGSARTRGASGAAFREQGADTPPTLPSTSTTNEPCFGGRAARRVTRNGADSSPISPDRPQTIADLQPGSRRRGAQDSLPRTPHPPRPSSGTRFEPSCARLTRAPGRRSTTRHLIRCVPSSAGWRCRMRLSVDTRARVHVRHRRSIMVNRGTGGSSEQQSSLPRRPAAA